MTDNELCCISYWLPKLQAANIPTPKTVIVRSPDLTGLLDGKPPAGFDIFIAELRNACKTVGVPTFLRTGQTSGKHHWEDTCFVNDLDRLPQHVAALVEFSEICDMMGWPHDVWAARELLPTESLLRVYSGMPVVREFRCFVSGPEVVCIHSYWPKQAILGGMPIDGSKPRVWQEPVTRVVPSDFDAIYQKLCHVPTADYVEITRLASRSGAALGGDWSVDVLATERGWFVTDCATTSHSFHWDGCPNAARFVS